MSQTLLFVPPVTTNESETPPFPKQTYKVIYADPPWQFSDAKLNRGGAERHYPTQSDEWIKSLPVSYLADDDSLLFLWASWAKLPEALEVMKAWGFTYKTCAFTWAKKNQKSDSWFMGMGSYTRANTEPCLLGSRGNGVKRINAGIRQLVTEPVARHSAKPRIIREQITNLVGDVPRIELFARETAEGWDSWGNEI